MKFNEVTRPNSLYQQWQALLLNRTKRTQSGLFIIQGVRPINSALEQKVEIESVLYKDGVQSEWLKSILKQSFPPNTYRLSPDLMKALGEKDEDTPELLLVAKMPQLTLADIDMTTLRSTFILVLDRPQNPGNIGAVVRSADALGAAMVILTGHAADVYDPKSIRASRGSLFTLPVLRVDGPGEIKEWLKNQAEAFTIIGLSEDGVDPLWDMDLCQPTVAVIGNETTGLSKQWKEISDTLAAIPMDGTASSLNAASSAAIALYEFSRQRLHR